MLTPFLLSIPNTPDPHRLAHLCRKFGENAENLDTMTRGRTASLWGRLLVRFVAARALGVPGNSLRWTLAEGGKPFFRGHEAYQFNISHTGDVVAAAVSDAPVGVDAECLRRAPLRMVERYFAPGEQAYVAPGEEGADIRFFRVWTRKEAYLKRSGAGIRVPLGSFDVTAPQLDAQLTTGEWGGVILSCCGNGPADPVISISPGQLLGDDAIGLD